jgi:predicted Ser/Thr protein kinase
MATDVSGKILDGRYRLLRRLGAGGMGTVFLAEDERLGRRVAVKRLHADSPEETARRFEREARLGAMLNHPNLVSVYDTFSDGEDVLIVMEYVDGSTLAEELRRDALDRPRALEVLRGVAAALDHAHAQGVVHRDVKPANILLGPGGVVKLADLGIATAAEQTHITRPGTMLGSPSYMAPEQIDGRPVTPAVDVYALAAVAFEALGGRKARPGGTPLEIAHRVVSEPPPDVREAWPDAPPGVAEVLKAGMAPDPADRPATCGELLRRLDEAIRADEPTAATERLVLGPTERLVPGPFPAPGEDAIPPETPGWRARALPPSPVPGPGEDPTRREPEPAEWRARALPPPPARPDWRAGAAPRSPHRPPYAPQRPRSRAPAALAAAAVLFLGGVVAWAAVDGPLAREEPTIRSEERAAPTRTQPTTTAPAPAPATTTAPETTAQAPPATTAPAAPPAEEGGEGSDAARARRLNDRGYALSQQERYDEAVPVLERALRAWPEGSEDDVNYAFTLYNLAHAYRLTDRPDEAIPLLERRLEVSDNQREEVERELELAREAAEES